MSLRILLSRAIIGFASKHYSQYLCTIASPSPPPPPSAAFPMPRSFVKRAVVAALTGTTALTAYSWSNGADEIDEKTECIRESVKYTAAPGNGGTAFAKLQLGPYIEYVINAAGSGFLEAVMVSSPFYLLKGLFRSPNGARLAGTCHAVCLQVPRLGGKVAGYFALTDTIRYALDLARQKDIGTDPWNNIAGDTIAVGLITVRHGPRASASFAALGGICIVIYGTIFLIEKEEASCWVSSADRSSYLRLPQQKADPQSKE